jgi:hypothetical protein
MQLYLEIRSLKRWFKQNGSSKLGPCCNMTGILKERGRDTRSEHTEGHVKTLQQGSHVQTRQRGFRRSQACWHLNLGPLASKIVRKINSSVEVAHSIMAALETHYNWGHTFQQFILDQEHFSMSIKTLHYSWDNVPL